jgi:phthalate 4,5-cis-dihydrodiol dehydrogenase
LTDRPHAAARTRLKGGDEAAMKAASAFGAKGDRLGGTGGFFGLTVASFEHGDVRQVPGGIRIYGDETIRDIALDPSVTGRSRMLDELAAAALDGVAPSHDGRWGLANLEVCLAALESSRVRREVELRYQASAP